MLAIRVLLLTVCMLFCTSQTFAQSGANDDEQRIQWQDVQLINGTTLKADALNKEVVIVEFWATWCPFCGRQSPNIEALHRSANKRYRVLTFSIDRSTDEVHRYMREHSYTFDVAMSPVRGNAIFPKRLGLPEVIVVKPGGVIAQRIPGEMFPEDVQELATKYGINK